MKIKHLEVKRAYYADPENVVVQRMFTTGWADLKDEPRWIDDACYRIKPKIIRIGEIDVPEPVRVALEYGQEYFIMYHFDKRISATQKWSGSDLDYQWLNYGLIHLSKEAAELHRKALILVSGGTIDGIDSGR